MTVEAPDHALQSKQNLPNENGAYAEVDGVQVYYNYVPPSISTSSQPLHICLHGFGASSFSFCPFTEKLLAPYDPPVLAYDAPGFGFTARPGKLRFYTPGFSARVASSLAFAFSPKRKYVVIAHSMGALAACRLLLKEPNRIEALILIAPAILPGSQLPKWLQRGIRFLAVVFVNIAVALSFVFAPILAMILRMAFRPEQTWRSALRLARDASQPLPDEIVDGYRQPLNAPGWEKGIINFTRATLKERAKALDTAEDFVAMISRLTYAPRMLIVHGESDVIVPLANSKTLAKGLGAQLKVMKHCGHVPHEEDPVQFSNIVYQFLHHSDV
ncbi:putative hydrolase YugF [Gracilariopsis chorda]|uniref:Putative hydrolase YugF n=1 Tax=Gracilariopsis chorda TaxID=448386 RepID=A0A2V3IKJ8_9FLOR|nr:putative hydrolase YugF [Gracilariopsis chorda]|eukprot:PXF42626.1 putative hydrolase YugF [Gracilariopsis chorda]